MSTFAPYTELSNRLVTLDVNQDFTQAVPVESGGTGPFTGEFPASLVTPDRNNVAPRLGLAWKPTEKWTLRAGYGVNFVVGRISADSATTGVAAAVLRRRRRCLARPRIPSASPPAFTEAPTLETRTRTGSIRRSASATCTSGTSTCSVGYRGRWSSGASYTGTRGGDLDVQRAPNRGPEGPTIPDVPPFIWEASPGYSRMNSLSLRFPQAAERTASRSGATYTLSKSMDDASTIRGRRRGRRAERQGSGRGMGASSFDQRHRFNADASYELPFGPDRRWLKTGLVVGESPAGGCGRAPCSWRRARRSPRALSGMSPTSRRHQRIAAG
jgi:hypothetical protein